MHSALTLPEIFVQLPEEIQAALEWELECIRVSHSATRDEVFTATELLIEDLKNVQFTSASLEIRDLLDQVPQAIVDLLF